MNGSQLLTVLYKFPTVTTQHTSLHASAVHSPLMKLQYSLYTYGHHILKPTVQSPHAQPTRTSYGYRFAQTYSTVIAALNLPRLSVHINLFNCKHGAVIIPSYRFHFLFD